MPSITMTNCPDCGCGGDYCVIEVNAYAVRNGVKDTTITTCYYSGSDLTPSSQLDSNYCFKGYVGGHETPAGIDCYRFSSFGTQRCFATVEAREMFLAGLGEYWDSWWYQVEA